MRRKPPEKPKEVKTQADTFAVKCPHCGDPIDTQAIVKQFGSPQGWQFYGYQGERWLKCAGQSGAYEYKHFITLVNGRQSNRIAWIKPAEVNAAVQGELL